MLTAKGKYGLKALIYLAGTPPGVASQAADIAQRNNIPRKFLDTILLELRNAGFVHSRKGPGGGYTLARPASQIRIGMVIRALDGPLAPIACVSQTAYAPCGDCTDPPATCPVRGVMRDVRNAIAYILDNMELSALAARAEIHPGLWSYVI